MRLFLGIKAPAWLVALGGLLVLVLGFARGNVLAIGVGLVIVAIAGVRQLMG